jgi:hypothetical protein
MNCSDANARYSSWNMARANKIYAETRIWLMQMKSTERYGWADRFMARHPNLSLRVRKLLNVCFFIELIKHVIERKMTGDRILININKRTIIY